MDKTNINNILDKYWPYGQGPEVWAWDTAATPGAGLGFVLNNIDIGRCVLFMCLLLVRDASPAWVLSNAKLLQSFVLTKDKVSGNYVFVIVNGWVALC